MINKIIHIIFTSFFGNKFFDIKARADILEFWTIISVYLIFPLIMSSLNDITSIKIIYLVYFILFMPWIVIGTIVRRMHDLNLSAWWLFTIVPLLFIPFVKGKNLSNRFGNIEY